MGLLLLADPGFKAWQVNQDPPTDSVQMAMQAIALSTGDECSYARFSERGMAPNDVMDVAEFHARLLGLAHGRDSGWVRERHSGLRTDAVTGP